MNYDTEKIDEVVLALMYLTSFSENENHRSWKGQDWETLDRLYEKGFIANPKSKSKSIAFSDDGFKKSESLFKKHFEIKN
jgi:hypothetical protein